MMNEVERFSISDEGFFGVSFLDMGAYGAYLMNNRVVLSQDRHIKLHFDEADASYEADKKALTIEGSAGSLSTSDFALDALTAYAKIAREMDELAKPLAS